MVPIPMPSTKLVMISCALFRLSGLSAAPICGKAGSIASIENATVATTIAISAMNSVWPSRWVGAIMICRRFGR